MTFSDTDTHSTDPVDLPKPWPLGTKCHAHNHDASGQKESHAVKKSILAAKFVTSCYASKLFHKACVTGKGTELCAN